jgi:hypothetical protein
MKPIWIVIVLLLFSWGVSGQTKNIPPFERRISVDMQNETVAAILTEIGRQAEFTFSYSPKTIDVSKRTSLSIERQTVRYALNQIFEGTVSYREKGKFIILQPIKIQDEAPVIIEGYLTSAQGDLLPDATVYNADYKEAATTNEYGYFRLELAPKSRPDTLKVSKQGFEDALLMPVTGKTTFVNLSLPEENKGYTAPKHQSSFFPSRLVKHELQVNSDNVTETFDRVFQLSFVPHIGTNNLLSGSTSNLISINILGGYTESVRAVEVGTVMNIVRHDARVFQAAGISNFVGGNFNGFQMSGIINHTQGYFNGFQSAGIINNAKSGFSGLQLSGIINNTSKLTGCQMAGIMNAAKEINGLQMACIENQVRQGKGVQVSGIINIADTLNGSQFSSLINKATYVKGIQLGVVNIADSCSGAQIGIVNICKKGYHQVEIYSTETFYTNIAYRGGTRHFYSIFMGGYDPQTIGSTPLYTLGAGIGSSFGRKPKVGYDADLLCQQVYLGLTASNINMLYRLGFSVNYKVAHNVALMLGLTYNLYLVDSSTSEYETTFSKLPPYFISNESVGSNENLKTWIGFKAGIRLF